LLQKTTGFPNGQLDEQARDGRPKKTRGGGRRGEKEKEGANFCDKGFERTGLLGPMSIRK